MSLLLNTYWIFLLCAFLIVEVGRVHEGWIKAAVLDPYITFTQGQRDKTERYPSLTLLKKIAFCWSVKTAISAPPIYQPPPISISFPYAFWFWMYCVVTSIGSVGTALYNPVVFSLSASPSSPCRLGTRRLSLFAWVLPHQSHQTTPYY